ncbi:MAG: hypothetical protein RBU23_04680 [Candidatus Auribacterota bacterium]|jgi:hypothetical protein|nr:hypothetical protein [Candidatus Auribacterota bacterium]
MIRIASYLLLIAYIAGCAGFLSGCASNESALQDNIAEMFDVTTVPMRAGLRQIDNFLDGIGGGLTDEDYEDFGK